MDRSNQKQALQSSRQETKERSPHTSMSQATQAGSSLATGKEHSQEGRGLDHQGQLHGARKDHSSAQQHQDNHNPVGHSGHDGQPGHNGPHGSHPHA